MNHLTRFQLSRNLSAKPRYYPNWEGAPPEFLGYGFWLVRGIRVLAQLDSPETASPQRPRSLADILSSPEDSQLYLERYLNSGSPSGFSHSHRSSPGTDPWGDTPHFHLYAAHDRKSAFDVYGTPPSHEIFQTPRLYIHPDMRGHRALRALRLAKVPDFTVTPTASSRTVQLRRGLGGNYIKLHYDGILGRANRCLSRIRAVAGPEVSHIILAAIEKHQLPPSLAILHEPAAKIYKHPGFTDRNQDWGYVWREGTPRGSRADRIEYLVPFFSLWSCDQKKPLLSGYRFWA